MLDYARPQINLCINAKVKFKKKSRRNPANKAHVFTISAHVDLVENRCKEDF